MYNVYIGVFYMTIYNVIISCYDDQSIIEQVIGVHFIIQLYVCIVDITIVCTWKLQSYYFI